MFSLKGKTVVVTGGGRGIGQGISLCMARAGANVVIAGRKPEPLESVAGQVRLLGTEALPQPTDVTNRTEVGQLVEQALERFGYIDCWVNNAGSAHAKDVAPLMDLTPDQWDSVVDLNMKWTFFASQAAARTMHKGGSIINLSSRAGSEPNPLTGQYGAAKAGLDSITRTMAVEWGHLGIRVNGVAPGVVLTEANTRPGGGMSKSSRLQRQIDTVPLGRLGSLDDVGAACVFLASEEASWITGEVMHLNGGSRISAGLLSYLNQVKRRADD